MERIFLATLLGSLVFGGCAGLHYQTLTSASYAASVDDIIVTTTIVVHD